MYTYNVNDIHLSRLRILPFKLYKETETTYTCVSYNTKQLSVTIEHVYIGILNKIRACTRFYEMMYTCYFFTFSTL